MLYIDMLLEAPEDEDEDDTDPSALFVSPSEVSSPAPPNPDQPTLTPVSTPASDSSISGTSTSDGPSSFRPPLTASLARSIEPVPECYKCEHCRRMSQRSRTSVAILETASLT